MEALFYKRHVLIYSLFATVALSIWGGIVSGNYALWQTTAGLLLDVTGLVQLDISGLFKSQLDYYQDNEKDYPLGPPSVIMRELMEEDHSIPAFAWVKRKLFMEPHTGFIIILVGCLLQLAGAWAK